MLGILSIGKTVSNSIKISSKTKAVLNDAKRFLIQTELTKTNTENKPPQTEASNILRHA